MVSYKTRAISLKTAPFAEADKMVTLFTRDRGKIRAIAKGARRVPSSLGGRVETLTYGNYFLVAARSIDIISQAEVLESFQRLRDDSSRLLLALYILRLVKEGVAEGQRYPELFDLLLETLFSLKNREDPVQVAKYFERKFVILEGINREGIDPQYVLSEHIGRDLRLW
ncbi:MAG: DNA repair protein RecO [Candidatus Saganbacteria bacterium]|nr:DNA repair protein RecO [Candidatus Saganbacteria bacterium]